jgi:hypothetical protein
MVKRPDAFWKWFDGNRSDLERALVNIRFGAGGADNKLTDGIRKALNDAGFDLAHEVGRRPSGCFHLIISADGDRNKIEDVLAVTRAAIPYDNWEVTAFRPPTDEIFEIEIAPDRTISMETTSFLIEETLDHTAVVLVFHTPAALELSATALSFIARRLVEARIGEFKLMNDVDYVFGMSSVPSEDRWLLRPFREFDAAMRELDGSSPN